MPARAKKLGSWLIWLAVTVLCGLYIRDDALASRSVRAEMKLEPGTTLTLDVFRLGDDRLKMDLMFRGDHVRRRPELGEWVLKASERDSGFLKFATPGAPIRLAASMPSAAPVIYEAMPNSGHGLGTATVYRRLTSDLSSEPGVWRWPPHYNDLALHRGHNTVKIDVLSVGVPLVGESVELLVQAPPGLTVFGWSVIIAIQLTWGIVLAARTWKVRR